MSTKELTQNVRVRRHNGQCAFGDWLAVSDAAVPEWVGEWIADEIAENDAGSGRVDRAGSIWIWEKI